MLEYMVDEVYGITDIILGATAVAASLAMHFYPMPSFGRIERQNIKVYEEVWTYIPYFATHLSCLLWIGYSIPTTRGSPLAFQKYCLLNINILGLLFQIDYLNIYQKYSLYPLEHDGMNCLVLIESMLLLMAIFFLDDRCHPITGPDEISKYLGPAAVVFETLMHMSHLTTIMDVDRTKYLPFGMCAVYLLDAVAWFAYSYAYAPTYDVYICIASSIGIVLEIGQLLLCIILYMKFQNAGRRCDIR